MFGQAASMSYPANKMHCHGQRWVNSASRSRRAMVALVLTAIVVGFSGQIASAQTQMAPTFAAPAPPDAIHWKQQLFLIPYQWGSAADSAAARAVWLFVSKDRGATWQRISEATPQVKAFNYRAEGDGEYWFAVRTVDSMGRVSPAGSYQPELRVIVDTAVPRIEQFQCGLLADGTIDVAWRCTDQNIDAATWRVEAQPHPTAPWQAVPLLNVSADPPGQSIAGGVFAGRGVGRLPAGLQPALVRASVSDRAGNTATYQCPVGAAPLLAGPLLAQPLTSGAPTNPTIATPPNNSIVTAPALQPAAPVPYMAPGSAPSTTTANPPANQQWPADNVRAPFRLWTGGTKSSDDGVTAYGNPPLFDAPPMDGGKLVPLSNDTRVQAKYAGATSAHFGSQTTLAPLATVNANEAPGRVEPQHESGIRRLPSPYGPELSLEYNASRESITPVDAASPEAVVPICAPSLPPKRVGARTFALEYDLDQVGHAGVSKVELWGTRDGGRTWRSYAQDDDNRSPLIVTVDEVGLYGFRIVVQNPGSSAATNAPLPGDSPELWVDVDLRRPTVELTAIERGQGNQADHLVLRWRADDNNLEPRPISLFYSSRPSGPWSAVATNLENTGEYAWRVERHVPARFYLRLEAHDNAGNLAAFQTREPVEFSSDMQNARLRPANPTGPTAVGVGDSYR
jgi:hypothetical protein